MESQKIEFTQEEFNAFAFAIKNRLAIIEMKALSEHGQTPASFKQYLDNEWEYRALVSLCRKFHID